MAKHYFVDYSAWAEHVIDDLIKHCSTKKFVIYPFGQRGKLVKSILNVYYDIQEYMIVDNILSSKYSNVSSLQDLAQVDLSDVLVLITSDKEDYEQKTFNDYFGIKNIPDIYDQIRSSLYKIVPKEKCVEIFPRPPQIYDDEYMFERADFSFAHQQQLIASRTTANYILKNFPVTAKVFSSRYGLWEYILLYEVNYTLGMMMEFGVCGGVSINFMSTLNPMQPFYGFDSFEGLPELWHSNDKESLFSTGGIMPMVNNNVYLVKGWFDKTIPLFLKEHRENCSFIHIDCDIYSSAKIVLNLLKPRIVVGTVIMFDEYFGYPGWQKHEFRAFQEFVKENHVEYDYLGYVSSNKAIVSNVAIRITSIG